MSIRILTTPAELQSADAWVKRCPEGNMWQAGEWRSYQESLGRKVRIYACFSDDSAIVALASVVIDSTAFGLSTWEIPRGPAFAGSGERVVGSLLAKIIEDAKKEQCLCLYFSPMHSLPAIRYPLTISPRHIHPQATRVIDLTQSESDILAQMHPKGRYNITLAKKHGVEVAEGSGSDIDAFYTLLVGTGGRDGFKISQKSHYARFLSDLRGSFLLLAKHENRPIAGLLGVEWPSRPSPLPVRQAGPPPLPAGEGWRSAAAESRGEGPTGIYYYGASSYEHRSLMAPYLLQWEAMRRSKARGCHTYDLLGISADKAPPDDPWWGITDFKRKFGGTVVTYPQEQEIVLRPVMKAALEWKRKVVG